MNLLEERNKSRSAADDDKEDRRTRSKDWNQRAADVSSESGSKTGPVPGSGSEFTK